MNLARSHILLRRSKTLGQVVSWILLGTHLMLWNLPLHAFVLTTQSVVESVTQHFPKLLMQQEKVQQAMDKTLSSTGAFDPSLAGKFDVVPKGGYEHRYL